MQSAQHLKITSSLVQRPTAALFPRLLAKGIHTATARLPRSSPYPPKLRLRTSWTFDQASYSSDSATSHLQPPDYLSDTEKTIFEKLKGELQPIRLEVQDISGGCGSMFGLDIVSPKFAGLSTIKQHQMVNRVLAQEIKGWHGMQLKTKAS